MKRRNPSWSRPRQQGVAAIEVALLLPVLVVMLAMPLFWGRVFYQYEVAERAAHDAALYLSTVPLIEMKTISQTTNEPALAAAIVAAELAELKSNYIPPAVAIQCDSLPCESISVPSTIRVVIRLSILDEFFGPYNPFVTGDTGLALTAEVTMHYVGK